MVFEFTGSDEFVKNIVYLRKKYCLSRKAMGRLIGLSEYTIKYMEQEKFPLIISYDVLKRLRIVFDVTTEALLHSYLDPDHH